MADDDDAIWVYSNLAHESSEKPYEPAPKPEARGFSGGTLNMATIS